MRATTQAVPIVSRKHRSNIKNKVAKTLRACGCEDCSEWSPCTWGDCRLRIMGSAALAWEMSPTQVSVRHRRAQQLSCLSCTTHFSPGTCNSLTILAVFIWWQHARVLKENRVGGMEKHLNSPDLKLRLFGAGLSFALKVS